MKVATLQQDKSKRNGNKYVMSTNFTGMMQITESECLKLRAGVRGGGGVGVWAANRRNHVISFVSFVSSDKKNYNINQETSMWILLHTQVGVYTVFIPSNGVY